MRYSAGLVDEDPQHASFAPAAQLDFNYFQASRGRDSLCYFPNSINVKCHETSDLLADAQQKNGLKLKSGLAPTGVFRQSWYYTTVSNHKYTPVRSKRQTAQANGVMTRLVLGRR
jgi:hypothetical protein